LGLIYLDTCICIHAVEQASAFHEPVIAAFAAEPDARFALSHLTISECLVAPLRARDALLTRDFEAFFQRLTILDCNAEVFRLAANIRAETALKMPDALHVACATWHGCIGLWTNDTRLSKASTLAKVMV
jgi:uncharacterized protein